MPFVMDACVAIAWVMRDEDHPLADLAFSRAQLQPVLVPAIWWYEVRNILAVSELRERITPDDTTEFLMNLGHFTIELHMPGDDRKVVELVRRHKLKVYEATHLALAIREKVPLATLDRALGAAARAEGVPSLT